MNLVARKSSFGEDDGGAVARVFHVVPLPQEFRIFGAIANKDADIVEPRRGIDDVVIVGLTFSYGACKRIQTGLMPIFIHRARLAVNEVGDQSAKIQSHVISVEQAKRLRRSDLKEITESTEDRHGYT